MNFIMILLLSMLIAYLAGSINFAILVTKWVRGIDIRLVGNRNPGTSNVGREIGRGWAALVLGGDLAKGVLPLVMAREFFFPEGGITDFTALILTGISAIAGHCWPLYFNFRGGGGLATSIGIYMFFIPVEFFLSLVLAFSSVQLFFRGRKYAVGQLIPMIFVPATPVLVFISSFLPEKYIWGILLVGGYPWYVTAGIVALSLFIFIVNIRVVKERFSIRGTANR